MVRELMDADSEPVIAFVGGGASAALTAIALLRSTTWLRLRYRVVLLDEHGRHARGAAYSTTDDGHLLDSPAKGMSALPDRPGHLVEWARERGLACTPETFLPRRRYGDYLAATLAETAAWAEPHARLESRTARVTAVESRADRVRLHLADGGRLDAAAAVVATGDARADPPTGAAEAPRSGLVADPWHPTSGIARLAGCRSVLAVGTGLTMVDVALSVTGAHPEAVVHAVSRHGVAPQRHRPPLVTPPGLVDLRGPLSLRLLTRRVRAAIEEYPGDWRHVVDSLRPHVPALWQGFSQAEQRVFLARLAPHWESARHRTAPEAARRLDALRAQGRLRLHTADVAEVLPAAGRLRAGLTDGASLTVDAVADCTGARPGAAPVIRRLLADGLARPDHLGLGIDTCPRGALVSASGRVSRRLFALGPVRRGQLYETTAVPEIRVQAEHLAQRIADTVLRDRRTEPTASR
ncbi:putative NAD(P)/FAD-binding protein YdhS [Spinactinospora alkalitolerans]|uniref:Putative NAD(P)/FAD-binding protein YdhS n=1 Tax=Spinactinospora alkalitolerans TaxID=687207 RepID=A0A852TTQ0_9ACTN|nr:FAD/NAD(P)-binding protein [Spinactinospora alkalitolerans]NYE46865.1 putative NAD(P)/FAD-binding protein YdhS [Spinactinospora alkalitolerans]